MIHPGENVTNSTKKVGQRSPMNTDKDFCEEKAKEISVLTLNATDLLHKCTNNLENNTISV